MIVCVYAYSAYMDMSGQTIQDRAERYDREFTSYESAAKYIESHPETSDGDQLTYNIEMDPDA